MSKLILELIAEIVILIYIGVFLYNIHLSFTHPKKIGLSEADIWVCEHQDIIDRSMKIVKPTPTPSPVL